MPELENTPSAIAIQWGAGLVDPLLSIDRRVADEQAMVELGRADPAWVRVFFAGLLSDLGGTLPSDDDWRGASARIGQTTVGPKAPTTDGAVGKDGRPWGSWRDSLDVIDSIFGPPETDPELTALSEGLLPAAAALVVASMYGWKTCREVAAAAAENASAGEFHQIAVSAIRWVAHRRRSYGFPNNDPWMVESFIAWAWRANDVVAGNPVDESEIDRAIRQERVKSHPLALLPDPPPEWPGLTGTDSG
jgi:hypothetical protein